MEPEVRPPTPPAGKAKMTYRESEEGGESTSKPTQKMRAPAADAADAGAVAKRAEKVRNPRGKLIMKTHQRQAQTSLPALWAVAAVSTPASANAPETVSPSPPVRSAPAPADAAPAECGVRGNQPVETETEMEVEEVESPCHAGLGGREKKSIPDPDAVPIVRDAAGALATVLETSGGGVRVVGGRPAPPPLQGSCFGAGREGRSEEVDDVWKTPSLEVPVGNLIHNNVDVAASGWTPLTCNTPCEKCFNPPGSQAPVDANVQIQNNVEKGTKKTSLSPVGTAKNMDCPKKTLNIKAMIHSDHKSKDTDQRNTTVVYKNQVKEHKEPVEISSGESSSDRDSDKVFEEDNKRGDAHRVSDQEDSSKETEDESAKPDVNQQKKKKLKSKRNQTPRKAPSTQEKKRGTKYLTTKSREEGKWSKRKRPSKPPAPLLSCPLKTFFTQQYKHKLTVDSEVSDAEMLEIAKEIMPGSKLRKTDNTQTKIATQMGKKLNGAVCTENSNERETKAQFKSGEEDQPRERQMASPNPKISSDTETSNSEPKKKQKNPNDKQGRKDKGNRRRSYSKPVLGGNPKTRGPNR
ncbi:nucleolar and coiled-body phosphoprotein 1-like [Ambystoma mexicanum]|uniref:nucleolar and coiled-body phosphoprotein 1-like n=1 Tax=Ambystoma mexicanum TaxID=8296 RepID=UPI0037E8CF12